MYLEDQSESIPSLVIKNDRDSLKVKKVVPTAKELLGDGRQSSSPRCCRFLLHTINFQRHLEACSSLIGSTFSSKGQSLLPRATEHDEKAMEIDAEIKDETYVAAFISCRLSGLDALSLPISTPGAQMVKYVGKAMENFFDLEDARGVFHKLAILEEEVPATSRDTAGNGVQVALANENHERPKITLPPRVTEELHADENTGKNLKRSFEAPSWPLAHPEASQFSPNTTRIIFEVTSNYAHVKSTYAQRETQKSHEKVLQSAQQILTEAEAQENEQAKDIKS
ncbi:hypothetical protein BUALT_Bualt10G0026700 [Buddleja alternifolia]|uniref:Uncharacterized protein n=1 Tax=Buddleja alternifolia TaxID=168488 RepID=A0AAV6X3N0_9LAMI|nr:hypothetical protein BUALT_Bualt10G0026700 [Buddleja alternifolia]